MNPTQFLDWLERKAQCISDPILEKPLIMGVVNVTPDSFSDGGLFASTEKACKHALHLIAQGADLIDIGGESTKPGAVQIPLEIELARVIPVIHAIRQHSDCCISIDTYKPEVMSAAVNAGANMINDVYALRKEGALAMAGQLSVPVCLMHMQGNPQDMQDNPQYPQGIIHEMNQFFEERINACHSVGIDNNKLILDPGFGFGKQTKDNLYIINQLDYFKKFNQPILLGVSRKSTIGTLLNKEVNQRLVGSIALTVYAALKGMGIIRTHDVDETNQALRLIDTINRATNEAAHAQSQLN